MDLSDIAGLFSYLASRGVTQQSSIAQFSPYSETGPSYHTHICTALILSLAHLKAVSVACALVISRELISCEFFGVTC